MIDSGENVGVAIHRVAEQSVFRYGRGILSALEVMRQMEQEWERRRNGEEQPSHAVLTRIAQRICSRGLYAAWRSPDSELRECAFENLRRYLAFTLQQCGFAAALHSFKGAEEDVLHQTLEELHRMLQRGTGGPDDPAAFLKWVQTIIIRQAYAYLQKCKQDICVSLDEQIETYAEQFEVTGDKNPTDYVEGRELHQTLKDAILSLRNPRYQQVLLYTYLLEMGENELAERLQVQVQEVYMWRHRALKALRSNAVLMQQLRSLRE